MDRLIKLLTNKVTGRVGLALARVIVKRTKTKVDDDLMKELGLMEDKNDSKTCSK